MAYRSWIISSDLRVVDAVCRDAALLLENQGAQADGFTVDLLLREFLNNAILHGNASDTRKRAKVVLRVGRKKIVVWVSDEGPGFDWREARCRVPDAAAVSGRGLAIGAQYAQGIRFNRSGNQVTLWIGKGREKESVRMSEYEMKRDGDRARVTLGERLTAAVVPALQPALRKEIGTGVHRIVFDLARTAFLDSTGIGLLIAAANSLAAENGAISLVNVSPDILKLLRSMRLADRLHASGAGGEDAHG